MPSRRIISNDNLKPIQSITVDAFSKFNSENINRLSKIVSRSGDNDVVINGLDVAGIDNNFCFKSSDLLSNQTFVCSNCSFENQIIKFDKQNDKKYYSYIEFTLNKNNIPSSGIYTGYFEISFVAKNGCPDNLIFTLNNHVINIKHLDGYYDETSKSYKMIFAYDFHFDSEFKFRTAIYVDRSNNQTIIDDEFCIKNLSLRQIFDNSKLDYYVSEEGFDSVFGDSVTHPIHQVKVTPGVAIKDNVTLDILKGNFSDKNSAVILDVSKDSSWITNKACDIHDFVKHNIRGQNVRLRNQNEFSYHSYVRSEDGKIAIFDTNTTESDRVLIDDFKESSKDRNVAIVNQIKSQNILTLKFNKSSLTQDDMWLLVKSNDSVIASIYKPYYCNNDYVDIDLTTSTVDYSNLCIKVTDGPVKVDGVTYIRKACLWAYVVVKYSYFKDVNHNAAYIGLIKEEDLDKPEYRNDYLILAKLRFVDCDTFDIITYSNSRQWLGYITASDINYWVTCKNGEIWKDDTPNTVTDAIDILKVRQINENVKNKYKHDYDAEIDTAFSLRNENGIDVQSSIDINKNGQRSNHLERKTTSDKRIIVTNISDPVLIESGLIIGTILSINDKSTYYVSSDKKWAVSIDFKSFGEYDQILDNIRRKYLNFNTKGPFTFQDKDTKTVVCTLDCIFDENNGLIYPTSPSDSEDVKDDFLLSYTNQEGSSDDKLNDDKNHNKYLIFRSRYISSDTANLLCDTLPNDPESLINKRVVYGYLGNDGKVRIKSSNHEIDDSMIDDHVIKSITDESDNHKLETSTTIVFDNDIKNNEFLIAKDVSEKKDKSVLKITNSGIFHKNLQDDRIVISTDADKNNVVNIESSEYSIDDVFNSYWYQPKISFDDKINSETKLYITIDTEKNFVIRVSQLIKWLIDNGKAKDYIRHNNNLNITNKRLFNLGVRIDATKSKNRSLDKDISDEAFFYEILERYFTSKLLLINDVDESLDGPDANNEMYFNSYVRTSVSMFYKDDSGKEHYFDNRDIWWKDDRRGYNNGMMTNTGIKIVKYDPLNVSESDPSESLPYIDKDGIGHTFDELSKLSPLYLYPANSENKINETLASDMQVKDLDKDSSLNAYSLARGNIRDTYAGAQTEYNFRYLKRIPEPLTNKYHSVDFNMNDVLLATSDYYVIPNIVDVVTPVTYEREKMNWLFTTNKGIISLLYDPFIVGDHLSELDMYNVPNKLNYDSNPVCIDNDGNQYRLEEVVDDDPDTIDHKNTVDSLTVSKMKGHIRFHEMESVNNVNNGCLSLSNICGDYQVNPDLKDIVNGNEVDREYSWVASYDGNTGIWRSQDMIASKPFRLLTATNIYVLDGKTLISTKFDVKKMVSWKNGEDINSQCLVVLSSDDNTHRSTVQVIPYTSIFGVSKDLVPDYLSTISSNFDKSSKNVVKITAKINGERKDICIGISRSSIKTSKSSVEWLDHMLVQDISVANIDGSDKMIYLAKARKDKYRFPPDDYNLECSDTPHHGSIIHNGKDPTNKKNLVTTGFDISSNVTSNSITISNKSMGNLNFDNQNPAQSVSNVIYTLHLDNVDDNDQKESYGNRFISVGSCINYCTGIDWELSSFMCRSKNAIKSDSVSSISDVMTPINGNSIPSIRRYGIFKKVFEFDGHIYITTTNGILKVDDLRTDTRKFISFESELKHTKWDDLPYNYKYSHSEKPIAWLTDLPSTDSGTAFNNVTSCWCKCSNGIYAACGGKVFSIYNRDRWTYVDNNIAIDTHYTPGSNARSGTTTLNNRVWVTYDRNNDRCLLTSGTTNGTINIYNNVKGTVSKYTKILENNAQIVRFVAIENRAIVAFFRNKVVIYDDTLSNNPKFTIRKSISISNTVIDGLVFNNKIYVATHENIQVFDMNLNKINGSPLNIFGCISLSVVYDMVACCCVKKINLIIDQNGSFSNIPISGTPDGKSITCHNSTSGSKEVTTLVYKYRENINLVVSLFDNGRIAIPQASSSVKVINWDTKSVSDKRVMINGTNYPQVNSTKALRGYYVNDTIQYRPGITVAAPYSIIYDECLDVMMYSINSYSYSTNYWCMCK